jgi:hypothetical protein
MSAKTVAVYFWPECQICLGCQHGASVCDDESGTVTGSKNHPFVICIANSADNNGCECRTFKEKKEES